MDGLFGISSALLDFPAYKWWTLEDNYTGARDPTYVTHRAWEQPSNYGVHKYIQKQRAITITLSQQFLPNPLNTDY